jgi:hypothetical protein
MEVLTNVVAVSPEFPPPYAQKPITYASALFADMWVAMLCLMHFIHQAYEGRGGRLSRKCARSLNVSVVTHGRFPLFSPVNIMRQIIASFLLAVICRAAPDGIWMLVWNPETERSGRAGLLVTIDWWGDVVAIIPFTWAMFLTIWGWKAMTQALAYGSDKPIARPRWTELRRPTLIGFWLFIIAVGMASYRATGG